MAGSPRAYDLLAVVYKTPVLHKHRLCLVILGYPPLRREPSSCEPGARAGPSSRSGRRRGASSSPPPPYSWPSPAGLRSGLGIIKKRRWAGKGCQPVWCNLGFVCLLSQTREGNEAVQLAWVRPQDSASRSSLAHTRVPWPQPKRRLPLIF